MGLLDGMSVAVLDPESVLDQAQTISPDSEDQDEKVKKWFEQLDGEDLGKYKM